MSTLEHPKPATSAKYEAFVEEQLSKARLRVRLLDISYAVLLFVSVSLAYGLAIMLIDNLFNLPRPLRQAAFTAYCIAAVGYLVYALLVALLRRVNPYYAALQVERALPEAKNSVVNWLDLHAQRLSPTIRASITQRAARDLHRVDLDQAISVRRAAWLGGIAAVLFAAAVAIFLVFGPFKFSSLVRRAFTPFSNAVGIATRTSLRLIEPESGNVVVPIGTAVRVEVIADGRIPEPDAADAIKLLYHYQPDEPYEELPLEHAEQSGHWSATVPDHRVHNGFWYKVVGGDAETPEYRVQVRSTPLLTAFEINYHFRPYLRMPDQATNDPNLEAMRGTEVTLLARTNRHVKEGRLALEEGGKWTSRPAELTDDRQALRFHLVLNESGSYRIVFVADDGETNGEPRTYPIKVKSDHPPRVELTKPGADIHLPANGVLRVEGAARDDFGVTALALRFRLDKEKRVDSKPYRENKSFRLSDGSYPQHLAYKDFLDLSKLRTVTGEPLHKGMVLEYWLEATDNCDYPRPNVARSQPTFKVLIGDPESEEQKQQQQNAAAKDQKQHEQSQDKELNQQQGQKNQGEKQSGSDQQQAADQQQNGQQQGQKGQEQAQNQQQQDGQQQGQSQQPGGGQQSENQQQQNGQNRGQNPQDRQQNGPGSDSGKPKGGAAQQPANNSGNNNQQSNGANTDGGNSNANVDLNKQIERVKKVMRDNAKSDQSQNKGSDSAKSDQQNQNQQNQGQQNQGQQNESRQDGGKQDQNQKSNTGDQNQKGQSQQSSGSSQQQGDQSNSNRQNGSQNQQGNKEPQSSNGANDQSSGRSQPQNGTQDNKSNSATSQAEKQNDSEAKQQNNANGGAKNDQAQRNQMNPSGGTQSQSGDQKNASSSGNNNQPGNEDQQQKGDQQSATQSNTANGDKKTSGRDQSKDKPGAAGAKVQAQQQNGSQPGDKAQPQGDKKQGAEENGNNQAGSDQKKQQPGDQAANQQTPQNQSANGTKPQSGMQEGADTQKNKQASPADNKGANGPPQSGSSSRQGDDKKSDAKQDKGMGAAQGQRAREQNDGMGAKNSQSDHNPRSGEGADGQTKNQSQAGAKDGSPQSSQRDAQSKEGQKSPSAPDSKAASKESSQAAEDKSRQAEGAPSGKGEKSETGEKRSSPDEDAKAQEQAAKEAADLQKSLGSADPKTRDEARRELNDLQQKAAQSKSGNQSNTPSDKQIEAARKAAADLAKRLQSNDPQERAQAQREVSELQKAAQAQRERDAAADRDKAQTQKPDQSANSDLGNKGQNARQGRSGKSGDQPSGEKSGAQKSSDQAGQQGQMGQKPSDQHQPGNGQSGSQQGESGSENANGKPSGAEKEGANGQPGQQPSNDTGRGNARSGKGQSESGQNPDQKPQEASNQSDANGVTSRFGGTGPSKPAANPQTEPAKGSAADPEAQRKAGELQLEEWRKNLTKDKLKELHWTDADWQRFVQQYRQALKQGAKLAPEKLPDLRRSGGQLNNQGARRVTSQPGKADSFDHASPALPPPPFREGSKEWSEKINELEKGGGDKK